MAFSNLIEKIEQGSGKFDLEKHYFVNNATEEDIIVKWGAMEPEARGSGTYTIKAGEMGGPYPEFLAFHIVKALVSREMQKDGKEKYFGTASMREPYETKFLKEADGNAEEALVASIREQEREKILAEMKIQPVSESGITTSETRRKVGRPKKEEFQGANR